MLQSASQGQSPEPIVPAGGKAAYDLAMAYACGSGDTPFDLVQAHRWFNVAALCGYRPALAMRAEIAAEMSHDEVVEAQKLARTTCRDRLAA